MLKDFIKKQTKFIRQIDNCKQYHMLNQAILIEGSSKEALDNAVEYLVLSISNDEDLDITNRESILQKENIDMLVYDLDENNMKKEQALDIQKRFMFTSLDNSNKQFYIIKGIDQANTSVLNSLLKFLEEPQANVYAIFTTTNKNKVLSTIVSRCLNLRLQEDDINQIIDVLKNEYQLSDIELVSLLAYDEQTIRNILDNGIYDLFVKNLNMLVKSFFDKEFFITCYNLFNNINKDDLAIFFSLLYAILTHPAFNHPAIDKDLINQIINHQNYRKILDIILSSRMELQTNMNTKLIIDEFSIEMEELASESC
ncbi:MAG: hypothetical protein LBT75_01780 [Bacilli bacterium]|jgi:DNA polymerase-3 subunit delta'|nr:hypothetical protein [Bacilli bacterium]